MKKVKFFGCIMVVCLIQALIVGCHSDGTDCTRDEAQVVTEEIDKPTDSKEDDTVASTSLLNRIETTTGAVTEAVTDYVFRWERSDSNDINDATGFVSVSDVIPDVVLDIRYFSTYNFVGERINGYEEPLAILSEETAYALKNAADDLRNKGYKIKIFDAYRPQRAVEHFASWAADWNDTKMKEYFYPNVDKALLFDYGYIAYYSGHSRGSKVDITLVDMSTNAELDMGGSFDYFDIVSHLDYDGISSEQYNNRMILRNAMLDNGFIPCSTEWWDFTMVDEPYPNTYFDFPVSTSSLIYKN